MRVWRVEPSGTLGTAHGCSTRRTWTTATRTLRLEGALPRPPPQEHLVNCCVKQLACRGTQTPPHPTQPPPQTMEMQWHGASSSHASQVWQGQ